MAAIACDICGGTLTMDPSGDFALCDSCGMKHTKDRVKLMAQEVTGTVAVSNLASIESLMKRGWLALEDNNWDGAIEYFDQALDINPEYAPAYVGQLCVDIAPSRHYSYYSHVWAKDHCFVYIAKTEEELVRCYRPLDSFPAYQKAIRFADETYRVRLEGYNNEIKNRIAELAKKYSFYMLINHAEYQAYYDNPEVFIGNDNMPVIGKLHNDLVFKVLRTGLEYGYKASRVTKTYGDITADDIIAGDIAVITHEMVRKQQEKATEQERINKQNQVKRAAEFKAECERREAEERRQREIGAAEEIAKTNRRVIGVASQILLFAAFLFYVFIRAYPLLTGAEIPEEGARWLLFLANMADRGLLGFVLAIGLPIGILTFLAGIIALVSKSWSGIVIVIIFTIAYVTTHAAIVADGFWGFIGYFIRFGIPSAIFAIPGYFMSRKVL